jgi:aryl-alcohol dehydrogenase-like predicted oxidoreductase
MADLPKRTLGRTGVDVTTLGYGAMELRALDDVSAEKILNAVLDSGINLIDTSIDYGRSEELLGKFIASRREEYFLATKCGCVVGGGQGDHVHTAANIRAGVENSLRLLKTDHLDLVQFHRSLTESEFKRRCNWTTRTSSPKHQRPALASSSVAAWRAAPQATGRTAATT